MHTQLQTRHLSRKVFTSQPSCGGCQHISNPVIGIPSKREDIFTRQHAYNDKDDGHGRGVGRVPVAQLQHACRSRALTITKTMATAEGSGESR